MKKSILLLCSLFMLLMTSCMGTASNLIKNQNQNQTSVVLSKNNYKIIGQAKGEVSTRYVLCFGGMQKKNLEANAIAEMTKSANLKGSQALINVNVRESNRIWVGGIIREVYCIATATVIEFTE